MRCIHIASFDGNIGDVLSHEGTYNMFRKYVKKKIKFTEFEIRDIYNKKKKFDQNFVNYVNTFDFLMIGGGNYFELWVNNSPTGTSINIKLSLLEKINIPILINSVGVDFGQGVKKRNIKKFKKFIDILIRKNSYLSFRNDGAKHNLKKIYKNNKILQKFNFVPDCGFFSNKISKKNNNQNNLGLNIAEDMFSIRYKNKKNQLMFLKQLSFFLNFFLKNIKNSKLYLFPHIYKDYKIIFKLLQNFDDNLLRKKIKICELNTNQKGVREFVKNISLCDYMISMRLHSNIASINSNIPTIGLLNYPQIESLYKELSITDRLVKTNSKNLSDNLKKFYLNDQKNLINLKAKYIEINKKLNLLGKKNFIKVNKWLNKSIIS